MEVYQVTEDSGLQYNPDALVGEEGYKEEAGDARGH
jgi:hypothetical protein